MKRLVEYRSLSRAPLRDAGIPPLRLIFVVGALAGTILLPLLPLLPLDASDWPQLLGP
jgi:hypothetical protein